MFVSFYTPDYRESANKLIHSLAEFNVSFDIQPVEDKGSWQLNCEHKPVFIKEMVEKYFGDNKIVWIDADAIVRQQPDLFSEIEEDMAFCWYRKKNSKALELLSGTMMFRANNKCLLVLDAWIESCKVTNDIEQRALQNIIHDMDITTYNLPYSYVRIYDLLEEGNEYVKPVIEHFQASREIRRKKR